MPEQPSLLDLHLCDYCEGRGSVVDQNNDHMIRCVVCQGTGQLDYQPPLLGHDPFDGIETQ